MTNLKRLIAFIRPYDKPMLLAAGLLVGVALLNMAMLWVVRGAVDAFLQEPDRAALDGAVLLLLGLFTAQGLLTMGHSYLIAFIGQRVVADFRIRLFRHLGSLSLGFFARRRTGELISRLTSDVSVIQNIATDVPINLAKQVVTFAGGVLILLGMFSDDHDKPLHGYRFGTGMHGGVIYVRGGVDESKLAREVGVFELTADDKKELEEFLKEYCKDFKLNFKEIMKEKFVKITPKSSRPYGNLYCPMPK